MGEGQRGPHQVLEDVVPRLTRAGRAVHDQRAALADAVALRDELVVRAVDEGTSQKAVAEAAGITRPRVVAILAASQLDGEDGAA